jgi:NADH:ubiquinone oxidoreductase subunit F (NADH-binding)
LKPSITAFAAVIFVVLGFVAHAQILEGAPPKTGTFSNQGGAFYNFTSGSDCYLKVGVWGFVRNPGRYNIPCRTTLLELMSFCGGPQTGAHLDRIKVVRNGGVDKEHQIKEVFEVDLTAYLKITKESTVATELLLWPGDLIMVPGEETTPVDMILRLSQVAVAITSIITAAVAVYNISR